MGNTQRRLFKGFVDGFLLHGNQPKNVAKVQHAPLGAKVQHAPLGEVKRRGLKTGERQEADRNTMGG
jgi:hypothetical protein